MRPIAKPCAELAAVFLVSLILRLALIAANPIIFGGDTILRLSDRFTLVKSHQLPLLQILIAAVSHVSMDPVWVRCLMALIGAVAGVGFYLLVTDLFGPRWAFPTALLFATNPFLTAVSTVPFQEILLLATLFFAFHFFYQEQWWMASLFLAAACFTRHEAWAACPVLAVAFAWRQGKTVASCAKALLLFACAPVLWILYSRGLAPGDHFVLDRSLSIWRLSRWAYVAWIALKFTQLTVVVLAAIGLWRILTRHTAVDWRFVTQFAFLGLFLVSLLFSAHGVLPDPERFVTSREAHIPIYFAILLAAAGLQQWPRLVWPAAAVSVLLGAAGAWWYLRVETSQPDVQLTYRVAHYLDAHVTPTERALILAKPLDAERSLYFRKVRELSGPLAERRAREDLRREQPDAFEVVRLRVFSHLAPEQLLAPPVNCADWIAVWSDSPDRGPANAAPVTILREGALSVSIFRTTCRE